MGNTYDSAAEADGDRDQQRKLLAALGAWDRALRRDECGAWAIAGETGSIHTSGDGRSWIVFVACRSPQHWTWTKKKLSFCQLTQDGDAEGCLRLRVLPTPERAKSIRSALGIQKRRKVSATALERLKAFAFERKPRSEAGIRPIIGNDDLPRLEPTPDQKSILEPEPAK
jgi:hypothetical protein